MEVYSRALAVFLPYGISDHSSAILTCSNDVTKKTKSFRFANYIADKMEFGSLVKALKKKLNEVQSKIDGDPHNRALREMGVDVLKEYYVALEDEEKLLINGSIVGEIWSDDNVRYSGDQIPSQFVNHFKNFFRVQSNKECLELDNILFSKKISDQETMSMIKEVTNEEVKASIFIIDDNKAPRLDGFTSKFYKKAWHVVGNDVCGRGLRQVDPMSPYLFTVVMEQITHLCFVDDLLVMYHGDMNSIKVIKRALDTFSDVYGLHPNLNKQGSDSWIWKNLLELRDEVRSHMQYKIGNGRSISVWHDNCAGLPTLDSFISSEWTTKFPTLHMYKVPILKNAIEDKLMWKNNTGKIMEFASGRVWNDIRCLNRKVKWWKLVWFPQIIPRQAFMLWLAVKGKLVTQDKLSLWHPDKVWKCPLCMKIKDSHRIIRGCLDWNYDLSLRDYLVIGSFGWVLGKVCVPTLVMTYLCLLDCSNEVVAIGLVRGQGESLCEEEFRLEEGLKMISMKTTEKEVDTSKALDASLVNTKNSGTKYGKQDTRSSLGNDADADDTYIKPVYDEEPMAENMPRFSSNDMVHNHYLVKAKKKTQERGRNSRPSVMPSAKSQSTANDLDTFDDLFDYLQQFEKLVNTSRAKLEKSHDSLALVAHTGLSSRNTSSYYVTHPTSVVDYDNQYQQDDIQTNSKDPLISAMLLIDRAINKKFSNPTNNRLRTSSNTRNQAVIQGDWVNIQSRNSGNAGGNNRCDYVQEEVVEGSNETGNDEAGVILTDEQNDFLFADASRMEEIEDLSANICLMSRIQPTNYSSDVGPSYDSAFVSEVQSSSINENEEQMYSTHTKIINSTIVDDQIDNNILFDTPNENVNSGSDEKDTHVPNLYALEQLARNAYQEAEKQQIFAQKVQTQNKTLTSQLELYKEWVRVLENINENNNYLNESLEADQRAKHFDQQAQSQFIRDRDIIRDLKKQ
nr:hypothetical protein [Tanacetum cinerariifolium]